MFLAALLLSLSLAALTVLVLVPIALVAGRWIAQTRSRFKLWAQVAAALPLVLPPTVIGFYFLLLFGAQSPIGRAIEAAFGRGLVFSFEGILVASVLINIPFAVQPIQRAFESIHVDILEAAECCAMSPWQRFTRIELPLAWPGVLSAAVLTFAHTLGEFGVVLMVGGNIEGETRTLAIAIYDRVQAFDLAGANTMAATLVGVSVLAMAISFGLSERVLAKRAA